MATVHKGDIAASNDSFFKSNAYPDSMARKIGQYTVFLVDDSPDDRSLAVETLKRSPYIYNIHCFNSSEELAIHCSSGGGYSGNRVHFLPTIILLDIHMPKVSGMDLLLDLKKNPLTKDIPVVMLTNDASPETAEAAHRLGASACVLKPVRLDRIHEVICAGSAWHDNDKATHLQGLLAAIVESSDDAIISKSLDGVITSWNTSAERMFGYTSAEAVGKNISFIIPADRREEETHIVAQLREGKRVMHFETMRVGKDGRNVDISLTISPVRDAAGLVIGGSAIAQDIAGRRAVEAQLSRYMQALEKSNLALSEYAHTVSHDLKAPLRRVVQYCALLQEEVGDRLGADGTEYVARLVVQTTRLQQLVDDLLSYAQVLSAREERQELDLNKVMREITESLDCLIAENRAVIKIGDLPVARVYPLRIRQLFQNLMANAIKYHGQEDPAVAAECVDQDKYWLFSIRDNGMGVPEEYRATIFKAFERLYSEEEIGGSGLGLAICAKAVEMHGGRIWVESAPGGTGSIFFFTLQK
ncbi:MAG: PAS domain S-box protein [Alphaproteobacteria bacterium]|nr:MAG: PAS domain S-box protein [Alphaproteobacteria bacterium]